MSDDQLKFKNFTRRSVILGMLKFLGFSTIISRLYYLQIIDHDRYQNLSENNRIRKLIIPPKRGSIVDTKNKLLATNIPIYRIISESRKLTNIKESISILNALLQEPIVFEDHELKEIIKHTPVNSSIILLEDISWHHIAIIEANHYKLKSIKIDSYFKRFYPYKEIAGHITGYIGPASIKEIETLISSNTNEIYHDFEIGKNGIEKVAQSKLEGKPGIKKIEVDVKGVIIRELNLTPSINGNDVKVSIDISFQENIALAFIDHDVVGSAVVLDVSNSSVLSMYSSPSYNPNTFIGGIEHKEWNNLLQNSQYPLINKCISASYPAGSTFKIVTALAALNANIDYEKRIECTGYYVVGDRKYHCRQIHGFVNMENAIIVSCNVYFYKIGQEVGIKNIAKQAKYLGLGNKTGIELPYESKGIVPDKIWKYQKLKSNWLVGDTINASIGQGYILVTPIQLANMLLRIISKKITRPTLYISNINEEKVLDIPSSHIELVKRGMLDGVSQHNIGMPDNLKIAGKTGTAQVISMRKHNNKDLQDHGWFIGFIPYHDPKFIISLLTEHSGWGSSTALPIAKDILRKAMKYFL